MHILLLAFALIIVPTLSEARENFLVIMADDMGVDATDVYGEGTSPVATPNITALAQNGILFRNAYSLSQCAPTRAQALTGKHAFRTGIGVPGGSNLDTSETTIADILNPTHHTAAIGKWHIGSGGDVDHPIDCGFDYYAGPLSNIDDYEDWPKTTNSTTTSGSTDSNYTTYVSIDNADEAIAKIAEFDEDEWFIWLAFTAPHGPFHVPPPALTTITVGPGSSNTVKYKAAIEAMDTKIGDVIASIDPAVLADTTIIFVGDNGTPGSVSESPFETGHAKGTMYEGGVNVPFIVRSPEIDPADYGEESAALVNTVDIFATIAEIAGVVASTPDSASILPYLKDPTLGTLPSRDHNYAERFEPNGSGPYTDERRAVTDGRWKLIWRNDVYEEFYDLDDSPFETDNLLLNLPLDPEPQEAYDRLVGKIEARRAPVCPTSSDAACLTGFGKGRLTWRDKGGDGDKFVAKMVKGPAMTQTDMGDPLNTDGTSYSMCVYDSDDLIVARASVARAGELCDGRECWDDIGGLPPDGKGYKYKDRDLTSDGIKKILFKGGDEGKSKLLVRGKDEGLPDGVPAALLSTTSATVQLRGDDASECVSVTMSDIVKQETDQFKAR